MFIELSCLTLNLKIFLSLSMKIPDNSLHSFIYFFKKELIDILPEQEMEAQFREVFYVLFGMRRSDLVLKTNRAFSESEILRFFSLVKELKKGRPLAYVLQQKEFFGLNFFVNENVLIPRPETEELVDWILHKPEIKKKNFKILDIGTGSGCIAISLKKLLPDATVSALDVSEAAMKVAKKNADELNVDIHFIQADILVEDLAESYDLIVSNPPYISLEEKMSLERNVLDHEPGIALFADEDPLIFYKRMMQLAATQLGENTWLYWEVNQYLWKDLMGLLQKNNFRRIEMKKDINGNPRMIRFQNMLQ